MATARVHVDDDVDTIEREYWTARARVWGRVGPPWRPDAAACATYQAAIDAIVAPRVLVLGVTPELAALRWPADAQVVFVDRSAAMVETMTGRDGAVTLVADWRALPLRDGAFDLVLGDGVNSVISGEAALREVLAEVRRVARPDARLVIRLFLRDTAPVQEHFAAAPDDEHRRYALVAGLTERSDLGISRAEVHAGCLDRGLPLPVGVELWAGEAARLHLYTRDEILALSGPAWTPEGALGDGLTPMLQCRAGR